MSTAMDNPAPLKLHSIIIQTRQGFLPIALSNEYDIAIGDGTIFINPAVSRVMPASLKSGTASFHTLFGVNGLGKTDIMLRIAAGLATKSAPKNISVHYSIFGKLYFYPSPELANFELLGATETAVDIGPPPLHSVFYTSSPFEANRRLLGLPRGRIFDISPHYGDSNYLDGLALLALRKDPPGDFVKRAKIGIAPNLLSVHEICDRLSTITLDGDAGSILRELLSRSANQTLKEEILRLRVLCSIGNVARSGNMMAHIWPRNLVKIMLNAIDESSPKSIRIDDISKIRKMHFPTRRKILAKITDELQEIVQTSYANASNLIETIETLSNWLTTRKRGSIQATPSIFEANLNQHLPDRQSLQHCNDLGLVKFTLSHLSSGETALTVFSSALHGALKQFESNLEDDEPFFLLIDEGEMFLHPRWQRDYINRILKIVNSFPRIAQQAHILISSHSLIVAADTPPHCLIDINKTIAVNGFGLGPKSLLEKVYNVEELSGLHTNPALTSLAEYFTDTQNKISKLEALRTAEALADDNVRNYLLQRIEEGGAL